MDREKFCECRDGVVIESKYSLRTARGSRPRGRWSWWRLLATSVYGRAGGGFLPVDSLLTAQRMAGDTVATASSSLRQPLLSVRRLVLTCRAQDSKAQENGLVRILCIVMVL